MKKQNLVSIISALGGAAGYEINSRLAGKKKRCGVPPFYAVTTGSILAGILADTFLPEDEPLTHQDYMELAAAKNVK